MIDRQTAILWLLRKVSGFHREALIVELKTHTAALNSFQCRYVVREIS